jgi:hypothetical protein
MRGRFATQCHYRQWEIDELEMPDVWAMARHWKVEPPLDFLVAVKWGYRSSPEPDPIVVTAHNVTPFEKLPKWLRGAMVKRSGKTEDEYKLLVKQKRKALLLQELEEKRKQNGRRT